MLIRPETRCDGGVVQVSLSRLNHWLPGGEAHLAVGTRCSRFLFWTCDQGEGGRCVGRPRALWEERTALMVYDGTLPRAPAACLAWAGLPRPGKRGETSRGEAPGLAAPWPRSP